MNTDKPPFRTYYGKKSKWFLLFIIATNSVSLALTLNGFFDKVTFQFWFWLTAGLFIVSVVGSLIQYNRDYPKKS